MEVIVDYDEWDGPPLSQYPSREKPGSYTYVTTRKRITGIPAWVPYVDVMHAIFYCAESTVDNEWITEKAQIKYFDY
jgi:hypothetical protein